MTRDSTMLRQPWRSVIALVVVKHHGHCMQDVRCEKRM